MFSRERSCIECYKEQNHYELNRRRPKQIRYEKRRKKKKKKKKNEEKNEKWKMKKEEEKDT